MSKEKISNCKKNLKLLRLECCPLALSVTCKLFAFSIYQLAYSFRFSSVCTANEFSPADTMPADDDSSRSNPALDEASQSSMKDMVK